MGKPPTILLKDWNQDQQEKQERGIDLLKFLGFVIIYLAVYFFIGSLGSFSQNTKLILTLIISVLILILYAERKNIFRKIRDTNQSKGKTHLFSFKIFLIYGFTFSIGYWILTLIIPFIKTTSLIVVFLLLGLILELSAKVCQMFLYNKRRIIIDKWFILWVLIHSVVAYGVLYPVTLIEISNRYLFILIVGFGIAIVTHLIWRVMHRK